MLKSWSNLAMLAFESQQVILLRLGKIALGGSDAAEEMQLMTSEKVEAAAHATGRLMSGASTDSVVSGYRKRVRANIRRLSK